MHRFIAVKDHNYTTCQNPKGHLSSFNGHLLGPWGSYDDLELIPVPTFNQVLKREREIRLRLASAVHLAVHSNIGRESKPYQPFQQKKS